MLCGSLKYFSIYAFTYVTLLTRGVEVNITNSCRAILVCNTNKEHIK